MRTISDSPTQSLILYILLPNNKKTFNVLTESEVITGKSQTENLDVLTERQWGQYQGRGLRFPCNDRTDEVNKLFIMETFY